MVWGLRALPQETDAVGTSCLTPRPIFCLFAKSRPLLQRGPPLPSPNSKYPKPLLCSIGLFIKAPAPLLCCCCCFVSWNLREREMQQHQLMQMQPMMAGFNPNNVTTDIIQQYLDENKQLILQILDNQSSGKLSECAENQARLQRNLMYLAAIADSQPQPSPLHAQFLPPAMQGARYLQHQQAQQMTPSSLAAARSSMMYGQQPLSALQQQSMHSQLGMSSGVNSGFHLLNSETGMGGNGALTVGSFSDFGRNGDGLQAATRSLMGGGKQDGGHVSSSEGRGSQSADGTEALYLKGNEEGN